MKKIDSIKIILFVFCVAFYVYQYALRSAIPNVLNEELMQHFAIDATRLGSLVSMFYLTYTFMQIPVGLISDRFHPKKICVFALSCVSAGIILFVSTSNLLIASFSQMLLGCGCSFAFVLVLKMINEIFAKEKVALITSITTSAGCIGPALLGMVLSYTTKLYPWKNIVICIGIFGALLAVTCMLVATGAKSEEKSMHIQQSRGVMESLKVVIKNPQIWVIGIFSTSSLSPIIAFSDAWGISFLKNVYRLDAVNASALNYMVYFGVICGGPLFGLASGKLLSYKRPMLFGAIMMLLSFASIILLHLSYYELCVALVVLGGASACQVLSFSAAITLVEKNISATASGVVNMITMLGGSILTPIVGMIMDLSRAQRSGCDLCYCAHDYTTAMMALLLCICISIIFSFFVNDTKAFKKE